MSDAIYCYDTATVRFAIYPHGSGGNRVIAEIGEDPLRDLFGASGAGDSLVDAYHDNAEVINAIAIQRHGDMPERRVVLETIDFESIDRRGVPLSVIRKVSAPRRPARTETGRRLSEDAREVAASATS